MAAFIRALMVPFLAIPLFVWHQLEYPVLAVIAFAASAIEASWFVHRAWTRRSIRDDTTIAWVDTGFCVALMVIGSRAATSELRNEVMTEVVPYSLVASLVLGFAVGLRRKAIVAVFTMWVAWFLTLLPDLTQKVGSDLLGFILWYMVGLYVSCLLRILAAQTAQATAERHAAEQLVAEQTRRLELAHHRERVRMGLHDGVLSILDVLAKDRRLPADARRSVRRGALKARTMLLTSDPRKTRFEARLIELTDTFVDLHLIVHPRFYVHAEPPAAVADVVIGAAGEALGNARKHAGDGVDVYFFAEFDDGRLEVSVIDHGNGFDSAAAPRGGGLTRSFEAVRRIGGSCTITSIPGEGTRVLITWTEAPDGE
ncbi:ATP-binding protein [Microbispora sp. NPDC088329]|uniref:sensor histidine kinase n=1 Tax=Microbispora sp. NPDC088329 TaxID=3154869 RepID=UPI00341D8820